MSDIVIKVENLYKKYRLGTVGAGTLREEFTGFWAKIRGKENPNLKIGENNLSKSSQNEYIWALQDINFEVKQGEVLGIIGKNGAGKSTLLKILSKITNPTKGQVKIKGRIASLLEVGTGFHPELTGRENIFLNGAILGMTNIEVHQKLEEIIEFSGISEYIDTPVKRYSSGMYVRLAFAVAAHLEPEILVIDEVLAVGDYEFQQKCLGKINEFSQKGRTIIFVSHDLIQISKLCTKVLYLKEGKIELNADTEKSINLYFIHNKQNVHKQESGNDKPYFTNFKILGNDLKERSTFYTNEKIIFRIEWFNPKEIKGLRLGFAINSFTGQRLFGSTPEDQKLKTYANIGKQGISVVLPKNTLLEGNYTIDIALYQKNISFTYPKQIINLNMLSKKEGVYTCDDYREGYVQIPLKWQP